MNTPVSQLKTKSKKDKKQNLHFYSDKEERVNVISHALGFLVSLVGTYFLLNKSPQVEAPKYFLAYIIYCFSLLTLFAASTLYHSAQDPRWRRRLNIVDHAAIYLLIAGSYTPFALISLEGRTGWILFIVSWIFALIGVALKIFYTGRYVKFSTFMYVALGWMILFVINPLIDALPTPALVLLFVGGLFYSVGALFFSLNKLPYNHAIFHFFVLAGSLSHFLAIYLYV